MVCGSGDFSPCLAEVWALANARGQNMPLPWLSFRNDAGQVIHGICVSHRALRDLRGALHEDTLYGPTHRPGRWSGVADPVRPWAKDWVEDEHTYVRRKPVTELKNTKHLLKVRDPTIRQILWQHLMAQGVNPDKPGKIPGDAFKGENTPRMPSGVPIKRVRMLEESETFRQVSKRRAPQYVKPGSNHHIVYRAIGEDDQEKWTAEVVTMWDAAKRALDNKPLIDRSDGPEGPFLFSLSIGEMFELDDGGGGRQLFVVRKMRHTDGRLYYKPHTDARTAADVEKDNLYVLASKLRKLHACKVSVDRIGRVRRARD